MPGLPVQAAAREWLAKINNCSIRPVRRVKADLIAKAKIIVSEEAGTTRDRHFAKAQWNGRGFFVVDTGGEVISISSATATAIGKREPTRKIMLKVYGSSGWDRDAFLLPGVNLAFDLIRYTNFPVVVLNLETPSALLGFQVGGIVGHKFLSKYRVGIDLERSVLRLKQI